MKGLKMADIFEQIKQEYYSMDSQLKDEISSGYTHFKTTYNPEILKSLSGEELLDKMFLGKGDNENLCYYLEKDKRSKIYGGIGGGNASKFGLYYSKDKNSWVKGKGNSTRILSVEEAIVEGIKIRDEIVDACKLVTNLKFDTIEDYRKLDEYKNGSQNIKNLWVRKYFHMMFPEHFPLWYNTNMLDAIIQYFGEIPEDGVFAKEGQIAMIAKRCNIPLNLFSSLDSIVDIAQSVKHSDWTKDNTNNEGIHYWVCAPGRNAEKWEECYQKGILVLGWDELGDYREYADRKEIEEAIKHYDSSKKGPNNDTLAVWGFCHVMKEGDIVYAKKGRTKIIGRGIVKSEYIYDADRQDYKNIRKVDWTAGDWELAEEWSKAPLAPKTLTDITKYPDWYRRLEDITLGVSMIKSKKDLQMRQMRNIPLNQILYGPPGTGKTYNTVIECIHILNNDLYNEYLNSSDKSRFYKDNLLPEYNRLREQGVIEFITFHQSYSYEEFVEGIKPEVSGDTKEVEYNVKPGIFRTICEKASTPTVLQNKWNIDSDVSIWKVSLGGTYDNPIRKDCFENNRIRIGWDDYGENYEDKATEGKRTLDAFYQKMKNGDIVLSCYTNRIIDGIGIVEGNPVFDTSLSEYKRTRKVNWILKNIREDIFSINDDTTMTLPAVYKLKIPLNKIIEILHKYNAQAPETKENDQKFVLVIDEINRGNISKIFGELITLIEEDKRSNLSVRLPYSAQLFTVPKNLYIIGTMNTADRSIAAIDIALRRRFTFIPKMPSVNLVPDKFNMKEAFENLNKKIRILLDEDHQIGHSYFMNIETILDLKETWANKIIPLLNEYFYGDWAKLKLLIPGFISENPIEDKELEDEIGENCYYSFNNPFSLSDDYFIKATMGLKI